MEGFGMRKIDWKTHFANHAKSGLSVSEYCRQHQLVASQWYAKRKSTLAKRSQEFVPVSIKQPLTKKELFLALTIDSDGAVEFRGRASHPDLMKLIFGRGAL